LLLAQGAINQLWQSELYCHTYKLIAADAGFEFLRPGLPSAFFDAVSFLRSTRELFFGELD